MTTVDDGRLADPLPASERARRDRLFAALAVLASVLGPGLLLALPFEGPRAALGILLGWSLGLLMIVPSYVVVSRTFRSSARVFQTAFLVSTAGRMVLGLAGLLLFTMLVPDAPVLPFMAALGLAYVVLSAIELAIALRRAPEDRRP